MTTQNPADITAEIDINGIQRLIPHRYPFLLVDRLVDIVTVSYTHLTLPTKA